MTDPVHMSRKEKAIESREDLDRVLSTAKYVTLAMADGDEPYLVTVSHGYEAERSCLYFHCARRGRKIDVLTRNPQVYGQALIDLGYQQGSCDQLFETVQFDGAVTFLTDPAEKLHALEVMIRQLEDDPEPVIEAQTKERSVARVTIGRVDISDLSGKRSAKVIVQL